MSLAGPGGLVVLDKKVGGEEDKGFVQRREGKQGSGDQRGAGLGFAQQDAHPEARLPQPFAAGRN